MKRTLVLMAAVLTIAAGCSSDDDASTSASTTTIEDAAEATTTDGPDTEPETAVDPTAPLEQSVKTYTEAFGAGETDTVLALVTSRCRQEVGDQTFRSAAANAAALHGPLTVTSINIDLDGDIASVSYSVSEPTLSQSEQRWALEDGTWKWDAC